MTGGQFSFSVPGDGLSLARVDRDMPVAVRIRGLEAGLVGGWLWAGLATLVLATIGAALAALRRFGE
jgi:hypothetical protein